MSLYCVKQMSALLWAGVSRKAYNEYVTPYNKRILTGREFPLCCLSQVNDVLLNIKISMNKRKQTRETDSYSEESP